MNERAEATIGAVAALLVLFSAMVDPRIAAGVAAICLLLLAGYHRYVARRAKPGH